MAWTPPLQSIDTVTPLLGVTASAPISIPTTRSKAPCFSVLYDPDDQQISLGSLVSNTPGCSSDESASIGSTVFSDSASCSELATRLLDLSIGGHTYLDNDWDRPASVTASCSSDPESTDSDYCGSYGPCTPASWSEEELSDVY
jgi:hypothetical protein